MIPETDSPVRNRGGRKAFGAFAVSLLGVAALLSATSMNAVLVEPKARTTANGRSWANFGVCETGAPGGTACTWATRTTGAMQCNAPCTPITYGTAGVPARDMHADGDTDWSSSTTPNNSGEISSGLYGTYPSVGNSTANCNPGCPGAVTGPNGPCPTNPCRDCRECGQAGRPLCSEVGRCGPEPSAYYSWFYDSGQDMSYLFVRMRIRGNPTNGSGTTRGTQFTSVNSYNFLLDVDSDEGWKELWYEVHQSSNLVNLFFDNRKSQQINNDCPGPGLVNSGGTGNCASGTDIHAQKINEFLACTGDSDTGPGNCAQNSITRVVYIGDPNAPNDWFVDIQIPVASMTSYDGSNPLTPGTDNLGFPGTTGQTTGARAAGTAYTWASARRGAGNGCILADPNQERCEFYPLNQLPPDGNFSYAGFMGSGPILYQPSTTSTSGVPHNLPAILRFNVATGNSGTDPVQKDFLSYGNSSPTPVTLSAFKATPTSSGFRFSWTTLNEVGNAGFDLWARTNEGWLKVNRELIPGGDSMNPLEYTFEASGVSGANAFRIDDVAIDGAPKTHGPFDPDQQYGGERPASGVDWQAIAAESQAKAKARNAARTASAAARSKSAKDLVSKGTAPGVAGYPEVRFEVQAEGLYRVTYEQLAAAGLDLDGVPASMIALTSRNESVPVRVETAKGGVFGPDSFVEFYGQGVDTQYTRTNVYRLAVDPAAAKGVASDNRSMTRGLPRAWYMETVEVERDRIYSPGSSIDDPWYDDRIYTTVPTERSYTIDLDNVVSGGTASLSVGLWGASITGRNMGRDHHVQTFLNGSLVGDLLFGGVEAAPITGTFAPSLLREGTNTVTVRLPMDVGAPYEIDALDKYSITYPRAFVARDGRLFFTAQGQSFRVNGLKSPSVVVYRIGSTKVEKVMKLGIARSAGGYDVTFGGSNESARYVVSTVEALRVPVIRAAPETVDPTIGDAQYLVIGHPDFLGPELDPLVAARRAQGLTVKVVDVNDVYEKFNGGVVDPQAIRDFVAAAAVRGTEYVLLVGGDTFDYLDRMQVGSISFIPTFYRRISDLIGHAPSDGVLADLDGDNVADLAIGRLPVKSSADLSTVVAKTLSYPGVGAQQALFVADQKDPDGDSYAEAANLAISNLGDGWYSTRAYVDEFGIAGARDTLVAAINRGTALTSYFGHSDITYWSFGQLFTPSHVASLTNLAAPTVVVQQACWNTFFVHPTVTSLSDLLLLAQGGGAAAVIGPSTLASGRGGRHLAVAFYSQLSANPGISVGKALTAAKAQVAASFYGHDDVLFTTNLMGDPALVIR